MTTPAQRRGAFTIVEMLVSAGLFSMVAMGLMAFTVFSMRLIARNLATNHGHEAARTSTQRMLADLHEAASPFRLINFDGSSFSDLTPAVSADQDPFTSQYLSTRANGVRFRSLVSEPCRLAAATTPNSTELTFEFGSYVPQTGDKVAIPLISRQFDIVTVTAAPSGPNGLGRIQIGTGTKPEAIGFTMAVGGENYTTGHFFRQVAYTVFNNVLRFHRNYPSSASADSSEVHGNVTSPSPFALLYEKANSLSSDGLNLRVSLETYDLSYSARAFSSAATTHQTIIPPRNQPALITN